MKKFSLIVAFLTTISAQYSFAQLVPTLREDSTKTTPFSKLLNSYYGIKNALVTSDATTAAARSGEFVKAINDIDMKALPDSAYNVFTGLQDKLKADARAIASSDKIEVQRTAFSSLSNNIYSLAKGVKISYTVVYQQYCPMKKMNWLSSEAAIKNPYYGKMMLTCGKVTDTLK